MKPLRDLVIEKWQQQLIGLTELRKLLSSNEFVDLLESINKQNLSEPDVTFLETLSNFRAVLLKEINDNAFSF
jgi:hypothetical protein